MSGLPDAWDDEWSNTADKPRQAIEPEQKKPSSKQTKAQKRAQQAEFNRQLWAEAEGPKQTNYFLESRNVVPLRQEFKKPTVLLSRKGPVIQKPRAPPTEDLENLNITSTTTNHESSEDEEDAAAKKQTLEERQAQAAREREVKQRKYEERRLELFGPAAAAAAGRPTSQSGASSPASLTPPGSRSQTPNRGGKRGKRGNAHTASAARNQSKEAYEADYSPKPNSTFLMRREKGVANPNEEVKPIREPKGPDGTAGFKAKKKPPKALNAAVAPFQPMGYS